MHSSYRNRGPISPDLLITDLSKFSLWASSSIAERIIDEPLELLAVWDTTLLTASDTILAFLGRSTNKVSGRGIAHVLQSFGPFPGAAEFSGTGGMLLERLSDTIHAPDFLRGESSWGLSVI
jgi:hypothetical protein